MSLEENLVKKIEKLLKDNFLCSNLKKELSRVLDKDDETLMSQLVHCVVWKKKEVQVPQYFERLSGNFYLADLTCTDLVELYEENNYVRIEKSNIYLGPKNVFPVRSTV